MSDDDTLAADLDALKRGGARFDDMEKWAADIRDRALGVSDRYAQTGGTDLNDAVTKMVAKAYKPAEAAAHEFLALLATTLRTHGGSVQAAGDTLKAADEAATEAAGKKGG